jgi:SAM-dependent methyltransferase
VPPVNVTAAPGNVPPGRYQCRGYVMSEAREGSIERRTGAYRLLEGATPYALLQRALGAHRVQRALVDHFLDIEPGMRILDVGAGTGALRAALPECSYTALEPNSAYVAAMRDQFAGSDVTVVEGTTREMTRINGEFDRIVMIALLHHLDDATATEAFGNAAQLLAPGGRVVTMDNCFHSGQARVARTLAKMDRGANVRQAPAYAGLATPAFRNVRSSLSTGLLRVPYSHVWVVASEPRITGA